MKIPYAITKNKKPVSPQTAELGSVTDIREEVENKRVVVAVIDKLSLFGIEIRHTRCP